jgi:hypothetical protein
MSFNQYPNNNSEKIFTPSEKESIEWIIHVASMKMKEVMKNPESNKFRLETIKKDMGSILIKVLDN